MQLKTREEIDAPQAEVWSRLTNFDRFERIAVKRGANVERRETGAGPEWTFRFTLAGSEREMAVHVGQIRPEDILTLEGQGSGVAVAMIAALEPLGPERTAMTVTVDIRGTTFAGKTLVAGLGVGRGAIQERFAGKVAQIVTDMSRNKGNGGGKAKGGGKGKGGKNKGRRRRNREEGGGEGAQTDA